MNLTSIKSAALIALVGSGLFLNGCLTKEEDKNTDTTHAAVHTPLAAASTIDIGAQGHATYGSVIDLDSAKAWKSATANANQAGIDLVFLYYGSAFHLLDAVEAKAAGVANTITLTDGYDATKIKSVKIVKITAVPADQEAAKAAFAAGTVAHAFTVVAGDMFLVESTGGKLAIVKITAIAGSDKNAAATVTLQVNTI